MLTRSHKRFSAWLGLTAMCLALCVPTVSQWLAAHRTGVSQIDATLCSIAGLTPSLVQDLTSDTSHASHHQTQTTDHGLHGDVCGYCSLLANHPPLATPPQTTRVSFVWIARAGPAVVSPVPALAPAYIPPVRAPPYFS
ncbi:hypothetical protein AL486_14980 [Pandoraea apista]|nr:hypothetical protein AL486_14980 [Pandoraea apista]